MTPFHRPANLSAQSSRELDLTMMDATALPMLIALQTTVLPPICASLTVRILLSILTACVQQTLNAVPLTVISLPLLANLLASSSNLALPMVTPATASRPQTV